MRYGGIETDKFTEEEVLFFIRIKGKDHFFNEVYSKPVINELFGHLMNHRSISEYPNADHYIDLKKFSWENFNTQDFTIFNKKIKPDLSSIIFRCRGLRSIPFEESKELIARALKYWINFFDNHNYKLIVIHIIDNYVLDVMYRIAEIYNVKIIVLTEFFIRGYRRQTIFGEHFNFREVPPEEVREVSLYFKQKEKSFWLNGLTKFTNLKFCINLYIKYYLRVSYRYFFGYKILGNISYEYRFAKEFAKIPLRNFFIKNFFVTIDKALIEHDYEEAVYLPLHVYPEANVDYWIIDPNDSDYYTTVYEAVSILKDKNRIVYIKEHPGFLYQRDVNFYKKLKLFSNVRLINPFDENVALLDNIHNILIWHGSAGVEGIMQGKKVVVFDKNYYSKNYIKSLDEFDKRKVLSTEERDAFLTEILSGAIKFKLVD